MLNQCDGDCSIKFQRVIEESPFSIKSWQMVTPKVYKIKLDRNSDLQDALPWFEGKAVIKFATPNYRYEAIREDLESHGKGPGYLATIFGIEARAIEPGSSNILIAVTDDGFDFYHEDLQDAFYINPGESGEDFQGRDKRTNGIDDDNNGFIDDYRGWDFTGAEDNDPSPGVGDYHGTHIAGIIGASVENGKAQGIAPGIKVLPIRFSGDGEWNSIRFVRSYEYAIQMGAKIISTSYAIDQFSDDLLYQEIIDRAYEKGVLIFNSAGNRGVKNPIRQKFEKVILVGNSYGKASRKDEINPNSNYGTGVDIYAPGDIYSTLPNNRYGTRTGTSMATPLVAAVAGMVWSKNPRWSREEVVAQLYGTTDDISEKNPDKVGYLGHGRVNALSALTKNPRLPHAYLQNDVISAEDPVLNLRVEGLIDPSMISNRYVLVIDENGDRVHIKWQNLYNIGTNNLKLKVDTNKLGEYRLILSKAIKSPFSEVISRSTQRLYFDLIKDDNS